MAGVADHQAGERRRPAAIPFGPPTLAGILDPAVAQSPGAEALVDRRRRYTFAELDRAVDAAAALLLAAGAGKGLRVGCAASNGCGIVIAFLAAQRIGAVWVGINSALPAAEKARLLRHSGAVIFLASAAIAAEAEGLRTEMPDLRSVHILDEEGAWLAAHEGECLLRPSIDPHDVAAINYTSGTTGDPKGILHSQHSLLAPIAAMSAHGLAGAGLRRGNILPLCITNVMIVAPMFAFLNEQACVIGPGTKASEVLPWIERERIEVMSGVPTIIYDLVHAPRVPPSLKALISGGAPLPLPIVSGFRDRFGFAITNTYGLTEAPTIVTDSRARPDAPEGASGLALPHIALSIRDSEGRSLPPGEIGEICLEPMQSGPWQGVYQRLLGYWNDPVRTSELERTPWLRTGDIGRLDGAGWLFVLDRKSDLILRGGSNIYPQEIQRVLEADTRVSASAVIGVPDVRLGEKVFAFVETPAPIDDLEALFGALRDACRSRLAAYKTPDHWHAVAALPRNAGGKASLPELRRMAADLLAHDSEYEDQAITIERNSHGS